MLQLSQALLANMDVRKLLRRFRPACGGGSARLRNAWSLDEKVRICMVQFLDVNEDPPSRGRCVACQLTISGWTGVSRVEPVVLDRIQEAQFPAEGIRSPHRTRHEIWLLGSAVHRGVVVGALAVARGLKAHSTNAKRRCWSRSPTRSRWPSAMRGLPTDRGIPRPFGRKSATSKKKSISRTGLKTSWVRAGACGRC